MKLSTALALIRSLDITAELCDAHREVTRVDLERSQELLRAVDREDRAARRAAPQIPDRPVPAAKTAGRPGMQPKRPGGAS